MADDRRARRAPWRDWPAPARFPAMVVHNGLVFWQIDREIVGAAARGWLGPLPRPAVVAVAALVAGYYVVLLMAGVFGLALRPPDNRLALGLLLSIVAVLWGVHAATIAHSRYHIPLMPLVSLFAARLAVTRREPLERRRLLGAAAAAGVLLLSWVGNFLREDWPDLQWRLGRRAVAEAAAPEVPGSTIDARERRVD